MPFMPVMPFATGGAAAGGALKSCDGRGWPVG